MDAHAASEEKRVSDGFPSESLAKDHASAIEKLMARLGVDAALIGVPKLARILGIAPSTIYAYMRSGRFFMPYRLVNGSPMVRVDDLIDWYASADGEVRPGSPRAPSQDGGGEQPSCRVATSEKPADQPTKQGRKKAARLASVLGIEYEVGDLHSKEQADRAVDGLVASVLARMPKRDEPALD